MTMIVSRSLTLHPQSPALTIGGILLKESADVDILGVTFDSMMTFEMHLRSVSRAASQRLVVFLKDFSLWQHFSIHDEFGINKQHRETHTSAVAAR